MFEKNHTASSKGTDFNLQDSMVDLDMTKMFQYFQYFNILRFRMTQSL